VPHLHVASGWQRQEIGTRLIGRAKAAAPGGLALYAFRRNHAALALFAWHGFALTACHDGAANDEAEPDLRLVRPAASPDLTRGANA
jgi:GNAT superfamily N-acetyltransferase